MMRPVTIAEYVVLAVVAPQMLQRVNGDWMIDVDARVPIPFRSSNQLPAI